MTAVVANKIGICLDCNYPLHDLPTNRCPECGREFDPNDPYSMNLGRPIGFVARRILGPTGWPTIAAMGVPLVWLMWLTRERMYYLFVHLFVAGLLCSGSLVILGIRASARIATASLFHQPMPALAPHRRDRWLVAVIFACGLAVALHLPMQIAFAISRPAMDRFASELLNDPTAPRPTVEWVGLYQMQTSLLKRHDGGVTVYLADGGNEVGFARTDIRPPYAGINAGADGHLQGNWYWFSDD